MRRRWMSAILALTMALALTACGGDSSSSSSNDSKKIRMETESGI